MSHQARDLAASRAHAPHTSMFLRMLVRKERKEKIKKSEDKKKIKGVIKKI